MGVTSRPVSHRQIGDDLEKVNSVFYVHTSVAANVLKG